MMAGIGNDNGMHLNSRVQLSKNHPLLKLLEPLDTKMINLAKRNINLLPIGPDNYLWLIISGWLMGLRGNSEGDMKGTGLNGPGDILGLTGFSGVTKDVPFYALTDAVILRVSTKDFTKLMEEDPKLSKFMVSYLSERYMMLLEELEKSTLLPLAERIENFKHQVESIPDINVPKSVIAFAVGAHPVSVSRLLKK